MLELPDQFELICIASRTKEKAQKFAEKFCVEAIVGYENLIQRNDLDAIYLPLPTGLHNEWIGEALKYGKHVLSEKSLAMDYNSCIKLMSLARNENLVLMENFMYKYHRQHQLVWEKINDNSIGALRLFRSQFGFPTLNSSNFRYSSKLGGGSLLDAAAYTVSSSLWFMGLKQEVLSAVLYYDNNFDVDIYGNASLINQDGIVSQISFGFNNFYQCNYEFWGSEGLIRVPKAFTPKPNERTNIIFEKQGVSTSYDVPADNHFVNILNEFYDSIQNHNLEKHLTVINGQSLVLHEIRTKAKRINL